MATEEEKKAADLGLAYLLSAAELVLSSARQVADLEEGEEQREVFRALLGHLEIVHGSVWLVAEALFEPFVESGDEPKEWWGSFFGQCRGQANCKKIAEIIEAVDNRAMAADGPVTPTLQEMTQAEISMVYAAAQEGARVEKNPEAGK